MAKLQKPETSNMPDQVKNLEFGNNQSKPEAQFKLETFHFKA